VLEHACLEADASIVNGAPVSSTAATLTYRFALDVDVDPGNREAAFLSRLQLVTAPLHLGVDHGDGGAFDCIR